MERLNIIVFNDPYAKEIGHTWVPALLSITAAQRVEQLNEGFRELGWLPSPMENQGRLKPSAMLALNLQVTGASDVTVSYVHEISKKYRIEMRIGATEWIGGVSLRPVASNSQAIREFITYLEQICLDECAVSGFRSVSGSLAHCYEACDKEGYIKNKNNWPFYKPFAPCAKGTASAWYDITDSLSPCEIDVNWVQGGKLNLGLYESIELMTKAFV